RMRLLMPWPCGSPRGSAAPFERSRLCRLDPDAAAVHLHNLLGDGETKPGAALGLGVGAVDLVELLENAGLVLLRNAGPGVGHTDGEVAVAGRGGDAPRLSRTWVRRCSSPKPIGSCLVTSVLSASFLPLPVPRLPHAPSRPRFRAHTRRD